VCPGALQAAVFLGHDSYQGSGVSEYRDRLPYPPSSGIPQMDEWNRLVWREINYPLGNSRLTVSDLTLSLTTLSVEHGSLRYETDGANRTLNIVSASSLTGAVFHVKHVGTSGDTIFITGTVDGVSNYSIGDADGLRNKSVTFRSTGTAMELL